MHNRTLHISGAFEEDQKADIEAEKPDFEAIKPDIKNTFRSKTANNIRKLTEAFPAQTIFGRADVMKALGIKSSRASELLKELAEKNIIEHVLGHGKGKYRFVCLHGSNKAEKR